MDVDDLEPIELESFDVSPAPPQPREPIRPRPWWVVLGVCLATVWVVAAMLTRHDAHHETLAPERAVADAADARRAPANGPEALMGLRGIGSGRFAAIVAERLYLVDGAVRVTSTDVPPGASIEATSGRYVLVQAAGARRMFVDTATKSATEVPPGRLTFPATAPGHWWFWYGYDGDHFGGTIFRDNGPAREVPAGLHVTAEVGNGFLAVDAVPQLLFSEDDTVLALHRPARNLITVGSRSLALRTECPAIRCPVEILDPRNGTSRYTDPVERPVNGVFAPEGTLLALVSERGVVTVVDWRTGATITHALTQRGWDHLPVTWTADGRTLLVAQYGGVEVLDVRATVAIPPFIAVKGIQQIVTLP